MRDAFYWIDNLKLAPHPEGGYFREIYRSAATISANALPEGYSGSRSLSTSIYYLLQQGDFSAFHRIKQDETWHIYAGGPMEIIEISPLGVKTHTYLGIELQEGQVLQHTVPGGHWFAAQPVSSAAFALCGCTVAPGFDFADFEMATAEVLGNTFPEHENIIAPYCRS